VSRTVLISDSQDAIELDPESVRALVAFVLEAEAAPDPVEVSIAIVDDAAIAALNARHLDRREATDVLAFPMLEGAVPVPDPGAEPVPALLGDVVVSAERALAYCREHGGDPVREVALYLVHGVLHLLGYEDVTESGRTRMRARQRALLGRAAKAGVAVRGRIGHTGGGRSGA
jgi:probable rRNA maturation factor